MKLFYDKKSKDPTYYAQQGIRIGKKTTTRNVKKFGKHSELLEITDDPLAYVQNEIKKMNEEYRVGKVSYESKQTLMKRLSILKTSHPQLHGSTLDIFTFRK